MFTVDGNDEFATDDLKKEIKTKERSSYDAATIGADVQRMLTIYQRKGFFGTKIEPQKIELDDSYIISEGGSPHFTLYADILNPDTNEKEDD